MVTSNPALGVHYEVHGRGFPLMLGYPIMASATADDAGDALLKGYLARLTDRYRVLVMDYPDLGPAEGRSKPIRADDFTAQRVCNDLLSVADAAGFDRFVWWGFSWGGVIGLQLASRTDRVAALVCGAWPPLDGPYDKMLRAVQARSAKEASPSSSPPQQFVTFYESVQDWPEAEAVRRIKCPKMTFVGSADELKIDGVRLRLAATIHERRRDLEQQGWHVVEIPGRDHSVYTDPNTVVPIVREFLDRAV
jgi:pimeloyl-ACP methyl ester carboxylesterase